MTQRHSRRSSRSHRSHRHRSGSHRSEQFQRDFSTGEPPCNELSADRPRPERPRRLDDAEREARRESGHGERQWSSTRSRGAGRPISNSLVRLIEQDAPLHGRSQLVLMYGPFQAEMPPEAGQGVATWIQSCLRQHGIPSLVRFDDRRYAQVFRRDQFQPWVEHLMEA